MRCTTCGNETQEGRQYCEHCSRELLPPPSTPPVLIVSPPPAASLAQKTSAPQSQQYPPDYQTQQCAPQQNQFQQHAPRQGQSQQYPPPQYAQHQVQQFPSHPYQTLGGFLMVLVVLTLIGVPMGLLNTAIALPDDLSLMQSYANTGAMIPAIAYGLSLAFSLAQTAFELMFAVLIIMRSRHIITAAVGLVLSGICGLVCMALSFMFEPGISTADSAVLAIVLAVPTIMLLTVSTLLLVYLFRSVRVRTYMRSDAYITQGPWKFVKPPRPAVPDPPQ